MRDVIEELEYLLEKVEGELEVYYSEKVKHHIKRDQIPYADFYRGGLAALGDVKGYLRKEIKKIGKTTREN